MEGLQLLGSFISLEFKQVLTVFMSKFSLTLFRKFHTGGNQNSATR